MDPAAAVRRFLHFRPQHGLLLHVGGVLETVHDTTDQNPSRELEKHGVAEYFEWEALCRRGDHASFLQLCWLPVPVCFPFLTPPCPVQWLSLTPEGVSAQAWIRRGAVFAF